jgi:hypothetical protein
MDGWMDLRLASPLNGWTHFIRMHTLTEGNTVLARIKGESVFIFKYCFLEKRGRLILGALKNKNEDDYKEF